jgi:hypothetical protein
MDPFTVDSDLVNPSLLDAPAFLSQFNDHHDQGAADSKLTVSMAPPTRPRKRKAPTLRADAWEPYKDRIIELHITQGLPLSEVRKKVEEEFGFKAE